MIIDARTNAWLAFCGTVCDALGGIYLTYDLLGGRKGPLGFVTRAATYSLAFGLAYGASLGTAFGAIAGVGLGCVLALEFWRIARHQRLFKSSPLFYIPWFGAGRGLIMGLAAIPRFRWQFGALFGLISSVGLSLVYWLRFAPTYDYTIRSRPRMSRHLLLSSFMRGLIVGVSGALSGWLLAARGHDTSAAFGLRVGLTAGTVSVLVGYGAPIVEQWVENLPEKHLGAFGIVLIALGLALQSVQYLTVILRLGG